MFGGILEWAKEKRYYYNLAAAQLDKPIPIRDGDASVAPGYTTGAPNRAIYITKEYPPLMEGLTDVECYMLRLGILVHEILHQVFTDFDATEEFLKKCSTNYEKQLFSTIANVLEDPAIEYFASTVFGGTPFKALKWAIYHTYKVSPTLDESPSALAQYINALIQFGDMGVLKGNFTFPEAEETFNKTIRLFDRGVTCPNGYTRTKIAYQIFEMSKPLWEEEAKEAEAFEEMLNQLLDELRQMGKTPSSGSGKGKEGDTDLVSEDSKSKKRKITIHKISKKEAEEMGSSEDSGGTGGSLPDGDIDVYVVEGDDASGSGSSIDFGDSEIEEADDSNGDDEKSEKGDSSKSDESSDGDNSDANADTDTNSETNNDKSDKPHKNNSSGNTRKMKRQTGSGFEKIDYSDTGEEVEDKGPNTLECDDFEDYDLTSEDINGILNELKSIGKTIEKMEDFDSADETQVDDFNITSPLLGSLTCLNRRVTDTNVDYLIDEYNALIENESVGIKAMTVQLRKIFEQDFEERVHKTSGSLNYKRLNSGTVTARVFDRRREPEGKSDLSVAILVDESGSMHGSRTESARKCCIALAETFNNLNIPCYIMGFTADTEGHDVVHHHYVTWKNSKFDRYKLMHIGAFCNNCDGYSIRYITEILKKRNSKNKLLIVISDGQPAAYAYHNNNKGVQDTKDAIRAAKKDVSVLGVAIGNNDTETIMQMYEKDFLHVSNVSDLYSKLSKQITKIVRGWE